MINYNNYQGGGVVSGAAKTGLTLGSAGIKTQRQIQEDALAQAKRQGRSGLLGSVLGLLSGLAGSYLLPGLGGKFFGKDVAKFLGEDVLGKALSFVFPKALAKSAITASYKPEEFVSKTGFGLDKYKQLTERDTAFKQRGWEDIGTGLLTDTLMAMLPNPFGKAGEKMGSPGQQFGIKPKEWLGYTPTADAARAEVSNILRGGLPTANIPGNVLTGGAATYTQPKIPFEEDLFNLQEKFKISPDTSNFDYLLNR